MKESFRKRLPLDFVIVVVVVVPSRALPNDGRTQSYAEILFYIFAFFTPDVSFVSVAAASRKPQLSDRRI